MDHQALLAQLLRKSDIGRRDFDAVQVLTALEAALAEEVEVLELEKDPSDLQGWLRF